MRTDPDLAKDAVVTDDLKRALEAVSHLARLGHRRIALVGDPLNVSNGKTRYRKGLRVNGLKYDQRLVFEGDYRIESGYRAGLALLARRPEGVYVANFLMTVSFLKAAEEMGMRCPEDFGLVSFDDYPRLDFFRSPLTTVELPKYEVGFSAAELLLERISGRRSRAVTRKLAPQLRVRESCGFRLRTPLTRTAQA
jgi:DNA-binding LacI/PurR family transcriptional regulator